VVVDDTVAAAATDAQTRATSAIEDSADNYLIKAAKVDNWSVQADGIRGENIDSDYRTANGLSGSGSGYTRAR
jgi:hypothetical protein